jgi:hypothetical protein
MMVRKFVVCSSHRLRWRGYLGPALAIMSSEPSEDAQASPERHEHRSGSHRHRRHHRKRPFYEKWIFPYRRELKHFALFCTVVILSYLLWAAIAK